MKTLFSTSSRLVRWYLLLCGIGINLAAAVLVSCLLLFGLAATLKGLEVIIDTTCSHAVSVVAAITDYRGMRRQRQLGLKIATDAFAFSSDEVADDPSLGYGRLLLVGPGLDYATPGAAARVAQNGDVIEIVAGEYRGESVVWLKDDLFIRGVGGMAQMNGRGTLLVQEKAIWLIQGNNIRIEHISFSGAESRDKNGAGIRAEGDRLHIIACHFFDNETAILSNSVDKGQIKIEFSEFARNGHPNGQAHQIYINRIERFTLRASYIHGTVIGSALKTRARTNIIEYNRIIDGANGRSNYTIDISEGGRAFVIGNELEQGPLAGNQTMIAFAPEQGQRGDELFVVHNTIVNDRYNGNFVRNHSRGMAYLYNNLLIGGRKVVVGDALVAGNVFESEAWITLGNERLGGIKGSGANRVVKAGISNRIGLDYRLRAGSPAIDAALPVDQINGVSLLPAWEYRHPVSLAVRIAAGGRLDVGAREFVE